ncbi:MAG: hypothetical protein VX000_05925 [Myxococcota bacterium]|nr:hypothetical protein [Myxococcota bacterium]
MTVRVCGIFTIALLVGCSDEESSDGPKTEDKCPSVSMEGLFGQWIMVDGDRGDHTHRFEIRPDGPSMWLVDGGFTRRAMAGEKRQKDYVFTESAGDRRMAAFRAGEEGLVRLYVEPWKQKCSLRVTRVEVRLTDGKETERPAPGFKEYLPFPDNVTFNFRPCDGPLFLGDAARDRRLAEHQVSKTGAPDPVHALGEAIPVGVWSRADADGDAGCAYDMDLYFDDRPVDGAERVTAGAVEGDHRPWFVAAWRAPYSGNHHFEMWRYRSCEGGVRTLIDTRCLEAVLQ